MLDDDAYQHWLDQCELSDPARTLLTDIRRSPPVRRVTWRVTPSLMRFLGKHVLPPRHRVQLL